MWRVIVCDSMRTQRNPDNERIQSCEVFEMWYCFLAHTPAKTVSKPPRHARRGQRRKKKVYTRRVDNKLRAVKEERKRKRHHPPHKSVKPTTKGDRVQKTLQRNPAQRNSHLKLIRLREPHRPPLTQHLHRPNPQFQLLRKRPNLPPVPSIRNPLRIYISPHRVLQP